MQRFTRNQTDDKRLTIVECEGPAALVAHYNPKELQIDKQVAWNDEGFGLEYTGEVHGRKLTFELFLDCYEDGGTDLVAELETLHRLTLPLEPMSTDSIRRCPPLLRLGGGPFPELCWVIEALSIKLTMFGANNLPVRATATVTLKEVTCDERGALRRAFTSPQARARRGETRPPRSGA
jgi:hypothetical protein